MLYLIRKHRFSDKQQPTIDGFNNEVIREAFYSQDFNATNEQIIEIVEEYIYYYNNERLQLKEADMVRLCDYFHVVEDFFTNDKVDFIEQDNLPKIINAMTKKYPILYYYADVN